MSRTVCVALPRVATGYGTHWGLLMSAGLALISGAGCGVGFALAGQLARRGYDLIIADRYDEIHTAAASLSVFGTDVQAEQIDLCIAENAYLLHRRVMAAGRPLTAAALTTSVSDASLSDGTLDGALEEVDSCVRGTMALARRVSERMAMFGRGRIVLTASPEDRMPGFDTAVHFATAAFLRAFADKLNAELSDSGVKIVALMPEPVTAGGVADLLFPLRGRPLGDDPAELARQAYEALTCDEKPGIAAWATGAVTSLAGRFVPELVKNPVRQIISPTGEAV